MVELIYKIYLFVLFFFFSKQENGMKLYKDSHMNLAFDLWQFFKCFNLYKSKS